MNNIPKIIKLIVKNEEDNQPIQDIAVKIKLFANRKNDYYCIPPNSNRDGIIEISREWIENQIEMDRNFFIMDYSSTIDDCQSKIQIKVMEQVEIDRAIASMNMYKKSMNISDEEINALLKTINKNFLPSLKIIEFKEKKEIVEIEQKIRQNIT